MLTREELIGTLEELLAPRRRAVDLYELAGWPGNELRASNPLLTIDDGFFLVVQRPIVQRILDELRSIECHGK